MSETADRSKRSDPGLAARLLNASESVLGRDATLVGQLFETFAVTELITHLETVEAATELFHLRDRDGHEVDIVLERRGQVVGLEVKSSMAAPLSSLWRPPAEL